MIAMRDLPFPRNPEVRSQHAYVYSGNLPREHRTRKYYVLKWVKTRGRV